MINAVADIPHCHRISTTLVLGLFFTVIFMASGCGGTKIYNTSKTIVYRDSIYNIDNVQQITSLIEGRLSDDNWVNLKGADRDQFEDYVEQHGSVFVRMKFQLDNQELVYRAQKIDRWKEFQKLNKAFDRAGEDIADLLADKKDTQVELR